LNRRVVTLLTMLGAVAVVLSTIGAKSTTRYVWNASASVSVGLYRLRPAGELAVTELVTVQPPEPLATFLAEEGYLPRGIPMLKRVLALPGQTFAEIGTPSPSTRSRWAWRASSPERGVFARAGWPRSIERSNRYFAFLP
jgi:type IV secretory pathway protease TraF